MLSPIDAAHAELDDLRARFVIAVQALQRIDREGMDFSLVSIAAGALETLGCRAPMSAELFKIELDATFKPRSVADHWDECPEYDRTGREVTFSQLRLPMVPLAHLAGEPAGELPA